MVNVYIVVSIILALIIAGWLYHRGRKKANIERYGPLALFHTRRGIEFIEKIAGFSPLFWKVFATIGILVAFVFMFDIALGMYFSAKTIIETPAAAAGAVIVLPGLEVMGIKIPVLGWLAGIIVLLFAHEFAHGIIARAEKIRVLSVGGLFLGFLPIGAFVKPDEEHLKRVKTLKQLRIFAVGSFVNILISMVIVALIVFIFIPAATASIHGVKLTKVDKSGAAYEAGLREGMEITQLDNTEIKDWGYFVNIWEEKNYSAGEKVRFATTEGVFTATLADRGDGRGKAGIVFCGKGVEKVNYPVQFLAPFILLQEQQFCQSSENLGAQTFWLGFEILVWIAIINFGIGLVNLLPIKPLDGGLMMESVVKRIVRSPSWSSKIVIVISLFFFFLLLINIAGPHLRNILSALLIL